MHYQYCIPVYNMYIHTKDPWPGLLEGPESGSPNGRFQKKI